MWIYPLEYRPDGSPLPKRLKGYILGTRFATEANSASLKTTSFIEDPNTPGEDPLIRELALPFGRVTMAIHYGRVFSKLGIVSLASALDVGYALTRQLTFQTPVWTCMVPPFEGRKFIGGYFRTLPGTGPILTEHGWRQSLELPPGHVVFVGLNREIAVEVASAARGEWFRLDALANSEQVLPIGSFSSEFSWLMDGTVAAPATSFLPTETITL